MRRLLLLTLIPIVLAACSGGGSSPAPAVSGTPSGAAPSDPCTLVAAAELQALLGAAPAPVGPSEQFQGRTCNWNAPSGESVSLTVWQGRQFFSDDPSAVAVSGLGDAAHYVDNVVDAVTWRQGDLTAQLTAVGEPAQAQLVGVARQVSTRLT
jgi:hypothetical protein